MGRPAFGVPKTNCGLACFGTSKSGVFGDIVMARNPVTSHITIQTSLSDGQSLLLFGSKSGNASKVVSINTDFSEIDYATPSSTSVSSNHVDLDADGNMVIDMYCGYTMDAAQKLYDIECHCAVQVETINLSFRNSLVPKLRLRMVGYGQKDISPDLNLEGLMLISDAFREERIGKGADVLAAFVWAEKPKLPAVSHLGGYISLQSVNVPSAFRHSLGHNIGIHHCADGSDASGAHGLNNGIFGTIMCGNTINFYSNPYINVNTLPTGDVGSANAVTHWTENQATMSSYMPALTPLEGEEQFVLFNKTFTFVGDDLQGGEFQIPVQTSRMAAVAYHKGREDAPITLYLMQNGTSAGPSLYSEKSNASSVATISMRNVNDGQWAVGLSASPKEESEIQLGVYGFVDLKETPSANINCVIEADAGKFDTETDKWMDASKCTRGDNTSNGIEYKWEVTSGSDFVYIMPGGNKVPTTLLRMDKAMAINDIASVRLTCFDAASSCTADLRVGRDGLTTTDQL